MSGSVDKVSKDIENEIEKMIKLYDKDGNQKLNMHEIIKVLYDQKCPNPERVALQMLRAYDTNGDFCISMDEIRAKKKSEAAGAIKKAIRAEVKEIVNACDGNRDGRITFNEMVTALSKNLDPEMAKIQARFFFDEVDKDNNEELSIEELRAYVGGDLYNPQP